MSGNDIKLGRPDFSTEETDQTGADNDRGERRMQKVDGDKGERGDRPKHFVLKRFPTDPNNRGGNDGDDDRLESVKDGGDPGDASVRGIDETQRPEDKDRGNDKKCAGHDPAGGLIKKPPDVNGSLLPFR